MWIFSQSSRILIEPSLISIKNFSSPNWSSLSVISPNSSKNSKSKLAQKGNGLNPFGSDCSVLKRSCFFYFDCDLTSGST